MIDQGHSFILIRLIMGRKKYYEGSFAEADHERLKAVLSSIKGRFILSYNDDAYVRELYKGYNIEEISRNNSLAGKTKTSGIQGN